MSLVLIPTILSACQSPQRGAAIDESAPMGAEARDWDAVFERTEGWTGADAAYSVDLGDGRTLWLFGDTWIGSIVDGKHAPGSHLVNNSIAIQRAGGGPDGRGPSPGDITFYWGPKDPSGRPTAWITPGQSVLEARRLAQPQGRSRGWYWPGDGAVLPSGADGRRKLVLFLSHIARRPGDHGIWGFKGVGGALAVIDHPASPASEWHAKQYDNPHAIGADQADADPNVRQISWGAAVYYDPTEGPDHAGWLYVYGVKEQHPLNKQLLLARVAATTVEQFDRWRFRTADGGWSEDLRAASAVAEGVVNELSVDRMTAGGRSSFIMVHSEPVFGQRIFIRSARRPEGPWSRPVPVYDVPGVKKNRTYFTYAAKGHAHLSGKGGLLISYVINAHDFGAMVADAGIYRPRFIRVAIDRLALGWHAR